MMAAPSSWLGRMPIRRKLIAISLVIAGVAAASALFLVFGEGIRPWRQHLDRDVAAGLLAGLAAALVLLAQRLQCELADAYNGMVAEVEKRLDLERQLEQRQRLESLGVLAEGIAHDFNNILTGVLCSASLGRLDAPRGSALDKHFARIEENARRAGELCEQMLAYAGKGRSGVRTIDLNVLARETLELLHSAVPGDAEMKVELAGGALPVKGDPARLRQVVMNLVMNASEALKEPPRRIKVVAHRVELRAQELARMTNPEDARPGDYAAIEVVDTGVGIEADRLRRIFEPFHTTKFAGRGLGLSAVLGIVRSAGGALDVASAIGQGTTFRVYFPAANEPPAPAAAVPAAKAVAVMVASPGDTVLVVDDEPAVREVAVSVMQRMGFSVIVATNGMEAIASVEKFEGPLAGVLLDLTMPGMDGMATLRALRQLRPGIKAVLMSGYDQQDTLPQLERMGFSAFVLKPFNAEMLWEKALVLRTAVRSG